MAAGAEVQIVYVDEDSKPVFNIDAVNEVVNTYNLKTMKTAFLPIGGSVRSGKSLLISLMLIFLSHLSMVSLIAIIKLIFCGVELNWIMLKS